MDKPLSKNLENIDENKTLKFGVHKACEEREKNFYLEKILRKRPLKKCTVFEIYRHKYTV